ncbi:MAG: N-acetylneuraminate synthase family protein [Actinomycetota bacterium]
MTKKIKLGDRIVGETDLPYVIAEIGVNHEGSLHNAKLLIESAKRGGADAAKFQTYKAGLIASKFSPSYWDTTKEPTTSQYELFTKYDSFGQAEYAELAKHCADCGIEFVSTPFDLGAVDMLDPLMRFFKIASADITNPPLLKKVAKTGKPVILSTGASNVEEIDAALQILRSAGAKEICLMHCILNYPTRNENAYLGMLQDLRTRYSDVLLGYSDHTLPTESMTSLVAANLLGAVVLEKHFTLDKTLPGNDHYHAMDEGDLARFQTNIRIVHELVGPTRAKAPIASEQISRLNARRSIVLTRDVKANQKISEQDLVAKRPGTGISPMSWDQVIGQKFSRDLPEDHILTWDDITKP